MDAFEPMARECVEQDEARWIDKTVCQYSRTISMKRIADALERLADAAEGKPRTTATAEILDFPA